ncbi:MAG: DNA polymerase III subunit delta [Rhodocyclaceae bacterium]|nr:DNA polymerase III subunit delta [Rhodocyclaceae bacterium]
MLIRPEQLAGQLEKPLAPLWLLHGDEPLLVIEAGDAIRAAARRQGYTEREVLVAGPGFRWGELALAAGNLSLFGGGKLVDLRIPSGKPGREGGDALARYAARPPSGIVTLVTLPEVEWKVKKTAWFSALSEAGLTMELNAPPLSALPDWIARRLSIQGQRAERAALEFMAEHVEGNLLAAHQEIQKLGLLHPRGELSLPQVQDAVLDVARFDTEKLRFALLAGDVGRCARLLDGLAAEGVAPPLVLWSLTTEIRALALLRAGLDRGEALPGLLKSERIFDAPRVQALQHALPRVAGASLRTALLHSARIDRIIKGVADGHVWDEFLQLCLRLAPRPRSRPPGTAARTPGV